MHRVFDDLRTCDVRGVGVRQGCRVQVTREGEWEGVGGWGRPVGAKRMAAFFL